MKYDVGEINRGRSGSDTTNWRGDSVGVGALHYRIYSARGRASNHSCVKCAENGEIKPARDWALIHGESGLDPFSDYVALCRRCHQQYDGRPKPLRRNGIIAPTTIRNRDDEVVVKYVAGFTQSKIAKYYGISQARVSQIISDYKELYEHSVESSDLFRGSDPTGIRRLRLLSLRSIHRKLHRA